MLIKRLEFKSLHSCLSFLILSKLLLSFGRINNFGGALRIKILSAIIKRIFFNSVTERLLIPVSILSFTWLQFVEREKFRVERKLLSIINDIKRLGFLMNFKIQHRRPLKYSKDDENLLIDFRD
jgi:hypothetical protein